MHAAFHIALVGLLVASPSAVKAQDPQTPAPADTVPTPAPVDTGPVQPPIVPDTAISGDAPVLVPVRVIGNRNASSYSSRAISTATRSALALRDIPQSVTVINRDLIADQSMRGMAEVVRYVPGITMGQGEGNRDQPTIRGNSTTADFFVDGVRDDAQYFRDLYNVEQVEALKGSNAMIFGRGGGGGVINRAMKEAGWNSVRELMLQGGSYKNRRMTLDAGQGLTDRLAGRVNAVYENSDLFRDGVIVKRQGVHPTLTFLSRSENTRATFGYENFNDYRTADRGIPSFGGAPVATDVSTFFGNPALSYSNARVHSSAATISQRMAAFSVRNTTRFTIYDKFYQNVFPGAVTADGGEVSISAYSNAHTRRNLLNQTDLTYVAQTGAVTHTLLLGAELGRQVTDNFRNTGYFNDASTSVSVPVSDPTDFTALTFRQSATDADNNVRNSVRSIYAQDQIAFSDHLQLVAGVRHESFGIRYHNNRDGSTLERTDAMVSPRVGLVVKPIAPASLYASYSVSYLPSAGDQFSSLTDVTRALEPEQFRNFEIGGKWDIADQLSVTAATYRLDRTNTRAPSPTDPAVTVQTGSQRSQGYELGVNGRLLPNWEVAGGFARQQARITSTTASAREGATVPVVPASSFSLWNKYQLASGFGIGLGVVHQSEIYTAIDNTVQLPSFTRVDGAAFLRLGTRLRAQMNLENVLNAKYYPLAHNNNNITPGSPRAVRLSLTTGF